MPLIFLMDNPAAFKHKINGAVVTNIATAISQFDSKFNSKQFLKIIEDLEPLELKQRVLLITKKLKDCIKHPYPEALNILMEAMDYGDLKGFELWPFSEFISQFGTEHFDLSMKAMYRLTKRFTSEFAVRKFILIDHKKVLKYFTKWAQDKNVHVRRWVSEGSRPLLPWGENLSLFIMDPTHTILLLDKLKFDEELYVRKSVANHLNDISKNHPQVVIELLRLWEKDISHKDEPKLSWIKRHALRTLIKKGHPGALKLMGVTGKVEAKLIGFKSEKKSYKLNEVLNFSFTLESTSRKKQTLIIDYGIDFVKANGKQGRKVYKLKKMELAPFEKISFKKSHSLKPITTMKYYSGDHHLSLQINGEVIGQITFFLKV